MLVAVVCCVSSVNGRFSLLGVALLLLCVVCVLGLLLCVDYWCCLLNVGWCLCLFCGWYRLFVGCLLLRFVVCGLWLVGGSWSSLLAVGCRVLIVVCFWWNVFVVVCCVVFALLCDVCCCCRVDGNRCLLRGVVR